MPKVSGPIGYGAPGGKTIPPGTPFDVDEKEAARLITVRGFTVVDGASEPPAPPAGGSDGAPPEGGTGDEHGNAGNGKGTGETGGGGAGEGKPPDALPSPSALQAMRLAELVALATERGLAVPEDATKRQIISALRGEEPAEEAGG